MTEDEAKTKWCPQVRNAPFDYKGPAANRYGNGSKASHWDFAPCIGSACMMWRGYRKLKVGQDGGYVRDSLGRFAFEDHGYCGLAGLAGQP